MRGVLDQWKQLWLDIEECHNNTVVPGMPAYYVLMENYLYRSFLCVNVTPREWKVLYRAALCTAGILYGIVGNEHAIFYSLAHILPRQRFEPPHFARPYNRLHRARFLLVARLLTGLCIGRRSLPAEAIIQIAHRCFDIRTFLPNAPLFSFSDARHLWHTLLNGNTVWLNEFMLAVPSADECARGHAAP
jgi:hypothetical protein